MDEVRETGVWTPFVGICRHEHNGDFKLIHYGGKEDSGMSYMIGNLVSVTAKAMSNDAIGIIKRGLAFYRVWPSKRRLLSEIGAMDSRALSKFIRSHKFVNVQQGDKDFLILCPCHRVGKGWEGIQSYIQEEIPFRPGKQSFFVALMKAFEIAT